MRMHMPHAHALCTCPMHMPHAQVTFTTTPLSWSTPHRYLVETPAKFQAFLAKECRSAHAHAHAPCTCPMRMPMPSSKPSSPKSAHHASRRVLDLPDLPNRPSSCRASPHCTLGRPRPLRSSPKLSKALRSSPKLSAHSSRPCTRLTSLCTCLSTTFVLPSLRHVDDSLPQMQSHSREAGTSADGHADTAAAAPAPAAAAACRTATSGGLGSGWPDGGQPACRCKGACAHAVGPRTWHAHAWGTCKHY